MLYDLEKIAEKEILPGLHAKFLHSQQMSFAYWRIEKGANLPSHSHPNEQVVNMLEGEFELRAENETVRLCAGQIYVIAGNVVHSGKALTECRILDVFYPVREDYIVK